MKRKESVWEGIFAIGVISFVVHLFYQQFFRVLNAYFTQTKITTGKSDSGLRTVPNEFEIFTFGSLFIGSLVILGFMFWTTIQIIKDKK
jgi:hypothetical protein